MIILDGKTLSQKIYPELKSAFSRFSPPPRLDIILIGDDPASLKYTALKQKIGQTLEVKVDIHPLPASTNTVTALNLVHRFNQDPGSGGIIVQLPLPSQINTASVLNAIDPKKDVDGLSATNLGLLFQNSPKAIASATPMAIIKLLEAHQIPLSGKNAVIIGRSSVVGLPLLALLKNLDATVTLCHSKTQNLASICRQADILISATNHPNLVTADFVKDGAVVVDVGYPQADVNFASVSPHCSYISPVPGGVGPMTIISLFQNLLTVCQNQNKNAKP